MSNLWLKIFILSLGDGFFVLVFLSSVSGAGPITAGAVAVGGGFREKLISRTLTLMELLVDDDGCCDSDIFGMQMSYC